MIVLIIFFKHEHHQINKPILNRFSQHQIEQCFLLHLKSPDQHNMSHFLHRYPHFFEGLSLFSFHFLSTKNTIDFDYMQIHRHMQTMQKVEDVHQLCQWHHSLCLAVMFLFEHVLLSQCLSSIILHIGTMFEDAKNGLEFIACICAWSNGLMCKLSIIFQGKENYSLIVA